MDWKKYKDVRKKMEATKMSIDRSIDKEDVVYRYTIELLSHKESRNNAIFCGEYGQVYIDYSTK